MSILAAQEQGSPLSMLVPLILIAVAFYFFLIRPQKKRQEEQNKMQKSLVPGSRVVTSSGIYGTVLDTDEGDILLEIADGVEVRIMAQAVMRVVEDVEFVDEPEQDEAEGDADKAAEGIDLTKGEDDKSAQTQTSDKS
ncbi:preprotein translocase subunit YajC [Actinocorallia sp. A-T 12471]|uniref:preprotein translocase subunit YajC n=1 Tax=Actinocorallia sp. A-T 12471 TaxID=3089813 RepID=UPI0029CDED73|nr:preprotein translocase subunit YajC [Actinocorallia sp. A-T 12471]MDX6740306.1 preprotein translocase subunit YajC [Actinocorallia sp. A-T 12471]